MTTINIAGKSVALTPVDDHLLRDIPLGIYVRYSFFEGVFSDMRLLFLRYKDSADMPTPAKCNKIAQNIAGMFSLPVVFIFVSLLPVVRERMVEQGVFFVISGRYAFLPNLFINKYESKAATKVRKNLSPTAQYILLYYLQHKGFEFSTIAEIKAHTPFSYLQIVRAVKEFEYFDLCKSEYMPPKEKRIQFLSKSRETWNKALPFLRNPVKRTAFTDEEIDCSSEIRLSGYNALAHYSDLNQVRQQVMAFSKDAYTNLERREIPTNPLDGKTGLQEWMYPPTIMDGEYVDRLSLWLTFKDNQNPRIRIALDQLIEDMIW